MVFVIRPFGHPGVCGTAYLIVLYRYVVFEMFASHTIVNGRIKYFN